MFPIPILLIVFNRPETSYRVFERIREQRPLYLYLASDGPRQAVAGEKEIIEDLRAELLRRIDWDCTVNTLFREDNLGCGKGPAEAISWFFSHVEKGIILEDDILPHPSFFPFMQEVLNKYEDCPDVLHITGQNFQFGYQRGKGSYYFSRFPLIWGWGTWKRAWRLFDFDLHTISFQDIADMPLTHQKNFQVVKSGDTSIWDYQWTFSVWKQKGRCIVPQVNLIENLGFGGKATHTFHIPWWYKKIKIGRLDVIVHPNQMQIHEKADNFYIKRILNDILPFWTLLNVKRYLGRIKRKLYALRP